MQASDFKVLQLVLEDQASLVVAHRLASLLASRLPVSLLLASVDLRAALLVLHLPQVDVGSHLGDRT